MTILQPKHDCPTQNWLISKVRAWQINKINWINNTNRINNRSTDLCKLGGQSIPINTDPYWSLLILIDRIDLIYQPPNTYHSFVHSEWVADQSHLAIIAANIHWYLSQKSSQANSPEALDNSQIYCLPVREGTTLTQSATWKMVYFALFYRYINFSHLYYSNAKIFTRTF